MKKILFITIRNPFSQYFSGDVIRAKKFIAFLSKKNIIDVLSLNHKNDNWKKKNITYRGIKKKNIIFRIFYVLFSVIKLQPLQLGYFYSPELKEYVEKEFKNYDYIFFQLIRTAQYMPKYSENKKILDLGDLYSKNYMQEYKHLFFLNPLKIIFLIESLLMKRYENYCFDKFDKVLLFSKREINSIKKGFKKNLIQINFGIDQVKKKYKFNKNNHKIIFIGNIKYNPNRQACFQFANKILPILNKKYPKIEFHIIGEISKIDKFLLEKKNNLKVIGKVKNLDPYLNKVICGIANLKISSGIQTKLLTYMSYGIPSVCSEQVVKNFDAIKNSKIQYYKTEKELINIILKFKEKKIYSSIVSKRSIKLIKEFKWNKILKILNKLIN